MTEQQKIIMTYLLVQQTQVYSTALNRWNQKEYQESTWDHFKTHFCEAQKSLKQTGALIIQDSLNHTEIIKLVRHGKFNKHLQPTKILV